MKQLLTILLLFPLFIACSSDDDNNNGDTLEEQIVGTWENNNQGNFVKILVFSKDKTVKGYYNSLTEDDLTLNTKYTVYANAVKFSHYTATIENGILTLIDLDQEFKYKRK